MNKKFPKYCKILKEALENNNRNTIDAMQSFIMFGTIFKLTEKEVVNYLTEIEDLCDGTEASFVESINKINDKIFSDSFAHVSNIKGGKTFDITKND